MKSPIAIISILFVFLIVSSCQPQTEQVAETVDPNVEAKAFINTWFTALNSSNWEVEVKPLLAEGDNFIALHKPFREAFPDYHATVMQVISDGKTTVSHIKVKASHKGIFPYGEFKGVEPSGKTAEWDEVMSFNIKDGKLADNSGFFLSDNMSRMLQLGIQCLPESEAEAE